MYSLVHCLISLIPFLTRFHSESINRPLKVEKTFTSHEQPNVFNMFAFHRQWWMCYLRLLFTGFTLTANLSLKAVMICVVWFQNLAYAVCMRIVSVSDNIHYVKKGRYIYIYIYIYELKQQITSCKRSDSYSPLPSPRFSVLGFASWNDDNTKPCLFFFLHTGFWYTFFLVY